MLKRSGLAAAAITVALVLGGQPANASPGPAGPPVPLTVSPMLASKDCVSGGPTAEDASVAAYISPKMNGSRLNSLNAAEASCARVIVDTIRDRSMPERAAVIALTTAITESTLHDYTESDDYDSLGLYQQRASWGTVAQRTDPVWSTNKFIDAMLSDFPDGSWRTDDIGYVCQTVQVSAYPDAYDQEAYDAQLIADVLWDSDPSGWATSTADRLRIYQTGTAGKVYETGAGLTGSSWSAWTSIGSGTDALSGPPAIIYQNGRYDAFAVAGDGRIWHRIYTDGAWNTWTALSATEGNPVRVKVGVGVSAVWGRDHQRLFYVGPDNAVYQTWYDDGWHSQSLGGDYRGIPGVIIINDGTDVRTDVYATGAEGYIYHRVRKGDDAWTSWIPVTTTSGSQAQALAGTGVAAVHGNGHDRLFYVSPGYHVYQTYYDNGWTSQNLDGDYRGVPAVVYSGNQIDLFVTGAAGNVFHKSRQIGGSWSGWTQVATAP